MRPALLLLAALAPLAASDYGNPTPVPPPWDYQPAYPDRSGVTASTTYEVGPGRPYATPGAVPWRDLQPGDEVLIHHRSEPYTDALHLMARGEPTRWITVRGVKGPNGERPVLDGRGARMPVGSLYADADGAGMVIVTRPEGAHNLYKPGYLHITGLAVRNVRPAAHVTAGAVLAQFTDRSGATRPWADFVAGIYVRGATHLAITDCELADNGLGLFINSNSYEYFQTHRVLIADNHFHGNGIIDDGNPWQTFSQHNAYVEAIGTVYEHNWFAPPLAGCAGDNIKDRSAGLVLRCNHIQGGADLIALRDPESGFDVEAAAVDAWGAPLAADSYVYANNLVTEDYLQSAIGIGDGYGPRMLRTGRLYFYANRAVARVDLDPAGFWSQNVFYPERGVLLFDPWDQAVTVVARNNLLYAVNRTPGAAAAPWALFNSAGNADFAGTWANRYIPTLVQGAVAGDLGGLAAASGDPGFIDPVSDLRLRDDAPFRRLDAALPAAVLLRGLTPTADPVVAPFVRAGATDRSAPLISGLTAAATSSTTAEVAWTTSEPADALVDYGTGAAYGATAAAAAPLATSHRIVLAGLAPGTTYHLRATSRDAAGNAASSADLTVATGGGTAPPTGGGTAGVGGPVAAPTAPIAPAGGGSGGCGLGAGLALLLGWLLAGLRWRPARRGSPPAA